ncbi:MAG: hypothetical protein LBE89_03020 [Helicobacteraceae bacterium]|jgi:hypothetical protein|nr:hypothetical protein [Helicobacteraceae bacterium]
MRGWRALLVFLAAWAVVEGALFETYYGNPGDAPQPPRTPLPQPQQPQPQRQQPQQPQQPQSQPQQLQIIRTSPAPFRAESAPPTRRPVRVLNAAPHGNFDWKTDYIIRVTTGFWRLDRDVSVKTSPTGSGVYYRPTHSYMGIADGSTLTHSAGETEFRAQVGVGAQLPNEGNYWLLEFGYAGSEIKELIASYAVTIPSRQFFNTIPFLKAGALLGYGDSEGLSPSSFGVLLGAGGYNYIGQSRRLRLEYGIDLARTEWLTINKSYGREEWTDITWHIYIGAAYKF